MNQVVPATAKSVALAEHSARLQEQTQYLTFMLNGEPFAIGILCIKEIIEYSGLTAVPMMPECIRGVINLRGAVLPVLDLAVRFGKKSGEVTKKTCIVIVEVKVGDECQDMGVVVDAVNAVLEIPQRHRTGARLRLQNPHRLHRGHGQGQRQFRDPAQRQPGAVGG